MRLISNRRLLVPFKIHMLTLGFASTNCYILGDAVTRDAIVIDPSDNAPRILDVVKREGWTVRLILATHAHFDHVLACGDVKAVTGAPFRMHRADLPLLHTLPQQMLMFTGQSAQPAPDPDGFVDAGDTVMLGNHQFEVRFTPGHAPGHVVFISHEQHIIFGGDCIFEGSIGRTDLPGSNYQQLMQSIHGQILSLPDDYIIAPGHGGYTTVADEKAGNPFYLDWLANSARKA